MIDTNIAIVDAAEKLTEMKENIFLAMYKYSTNLDTE